MAKAKKKKSASTKKKRKFKLNIDNRIRIVFGLAFLFVAIFSAISLISYFFTWQADQSFLDLDQGGILADPDI